ncbi:MAG: pyridoxamine 5'-phosphate oxidase family protein [Candidatus Lokiarchaeota archaeon]|nr:pyridoxamine 5'-phosphate oxidase family protein [Candidatus Lokiarchaeota archaeon]
MKDLKEEVKKIFKSKMWMVISTVDEKNQPHSSVVVYQSDGDILIFQTGTDTVKAKSIKHNNKVSITIPFRKNFLHKLVPAPPAELHFTATAEILPYDNEEAKKIFARFLKHSESVEKPSETIWVKIIPSKFISTYGVGIKLFDMRKPTKARNLVNLIE